MDYSNKRTRDEIRSIPDGTYTHEEPVLDDGACGGPYKLKLKIVKTGSDICFDFTGTDPQIKGPINCPLATTLASVYYTMRCLTDAGIPSNEGCRSEERVVGKEGVTPCIFRMYADI